MTVAAAAVAVGFGLLVGWGLAGPRYPRRPTMVSLLLGAVTGAVILAVSYGSHPDLAGGSLLLGCGTALGTSLVRRRE